MITGGRFRTTRPRPNPLTLPEDFQRGFQGLQEFINRLALEAVDDIFPAPGGKGMLPGPGALGALVRRQAEFRGQFGQGQVVDIQGWAPLAGKESMVMMHKLNYT